MVMKAKILNVTYVYLLGNPLFWGQNDIFLLRFGAKLKGK